MSSSPSNKQDEFNEMTKKYLDNILNTKDGIPELEVRFGTRGVKYITKIDYDNVIQKLLSSGFSMLHSSDYLLRIQNEYINAQGETRLSNIRTELTGLSNIQKYCDSNNLEDIQSAVFTQKRFAIESGEVQRPVNFDDFNFRLSYQKEKDLSPASGIIRNIVASWADNKKVFRYINRVSLTHKDLPIRIDLSIVKESHKNRKQYVPEYTFEASRVLESPEKYEIEIEVINDMVGPGTNFSSAQAQNLANSLRKGIKFILSGLQGTNYPISYPEQNSIGQEYLKIIQDKNYKDGQRLYPRNFIGPSSYTLQMQNIAPINDDSVIPNIRNSYTVTDKADGLRKMLFIAKNGKIYLIDTNMNIQFTGAVTKNNDLYNTILDGEHILHNKKGEYINLYAAFDIYFLKGKSVRTLAFIPSYTEEVETNFRLPILVKVIKTLEITSVIPNKLTPIRVENKKFRSENVSESIFQCCGNILQQITDGQFEYNTDGLIFTPSKFGVGSNAPDKAAPLYKITWEHSFKWKPAEFNTIDFLVTTKKDVNGQDSIGNIFQNGIDASAFEQLTQYKTLILRVGFDERKHGFINPCADVIEDKLPRPEDLDNEDGYKPVPFFPTNPYDADASICNTLIHKDENGTNQLFTEEGEVFSDETIVEFRYDISRKSQWKWVPLRVRYDKTAEYKRGLKNYGNAYHVANSNWYSIHNPITKQMIGTGENIPDEFADDDIYYNRVSGDTETRGLRDFHNLFVKKILIKSVANRGNTLIDYAVGKGGDFPKWIASKLSFVFGIDISKDNIENRLDGACARFLIYRKKFKVMPYALFVNGNSTANIQNGDALYTDKGKQITRAVFGEGPKDETVLGKGVVRQYGKGNEGFNISSCQFAVHYFFENKRTLNNFLRNISECTKVGGYCIGTSYDGKMIFDALRETKQGESISILNGENKLWQITKQYDSEEFDDNISSVGYAIDVYQESINKTFREYLVNYNYFTQLMENYGFVLLTHTEANDIGLPESTGMFNQLYGLMENEIKRNKRKALEYGKAPNMTPSEKQISFYNRYFVYKKVRNVDAKKVSESLMGISSLQVEHEEEESEKAEKIVERVQKSKKSGKKTKKKLKLV